MTDYSSLTQDQLEEVAYLFADDVFGSDPSAFDYELKDGRVTGRAPIVKGDGAVHARKPRNVAVQMSVREVPAQFVTPEMTRDAEAAFRDLARRIAERLIQSGPHSPAPPG